MTTTTTTELPPTPTGSRRRFELVRELGTGTFGTVYLADMASIGGFKKRVALKMLNPQWDDGSDAGRRLRDEARLLGRLRHRNIVSVDDLVRIDGRWGVVMEYVPGVDLERLVVAAQQADQPLPPAAALEICAAVADALHAAYAGTDAASEALSVVHRDIKPSNVLLTPSGEVKVLDFGIALARFDEREAKTNRVRYGSIPYMSPERVLGEDETTAGDVYALGCVLYELLKAERFGRAELGPDQHRLQRQIALERLIDVPAPVHALLEESLHYDPERRPSAANFASRAEQLARQLDSEHLRDYARRIVPHLQEQTADAQPPIDRVFSEESPPRANPTLIFDEEFLDDSSSASALSRVPSLPPADQGAAPTLAVDLDSTGSTGPLPSPGPSLGMRLIGGISILAASLLVIFLGSRLLTPDVPPAAPTTTTPIVIAPPPVAPPPVAPPPTETTAEVAPPPEGEPPAETTTSTPPETTQLAETPPKEPPRTEPSRVKEPPREALPPPDPPPESTVAEAASIRAVKFTAPAGASAIQATCGGVSGQGTSSTTLRNLPAGTCTVSAQVDGATLRGSVQVSAPGGFICVASGGALACR